MALQRADSRAPEAHLFDRPEMLAYLYKLIHLKRPVGEDCNGAEKVCYRVLRSQRDCDTADPGTEQQRFYLAEHYGFGPAGADTDVAALAEGHITITPLRVDMTEHSRLESLAGRQWLDMPGSPSADIAPETPDGVVDMLDLAVLALHWLEDGCAGP